MVQIRQLFNASHTNGCAWTDSNLWIGLTKTEKKLTDWPDRSISSHAEWLYYVPIFLDTVHAQDVLCFELLKWNLIVLVDFCFVSCVAVPSNPGRDDIVFDLMTLLVLFNGVSTWYMCYKIVILCGVALLASCLYPITSLVTKGNKGKREHCIDVLVP